MSASLHGEKVLVTREKDQASEFSEKILLSGGKPLELPLLKISCIQNEGQKHFFKQFSQYSWIFFTSANGVRCFFQRAEQLDIDFQELNNLKIAAVGDKTASVLNEYGYSPAFIPSMYSAEIMAREFIAEHAATRRILLIRGNRSRDVLPNEFTKKGIPYDSLEVYETNFNYEMKRRLNELCMTEEIDFLTFTSPSTVEAFMELKVDDSYLYKLKSIACVCIGTTTERKAIESGFLNTIIPTEFTVEGMLESMHNYIRKG